ncbi:MAG: vitamin K epoxide reductase family protein [Leptolyngbyaceae bacterium]|nr:vitamin K epoxide reductase family protein [Leptolyngbyaceae bacterium]
MVSRRRPTPWIHRWSRFLIAAIAILGIINTSYLTITKLTGGEAACPTSGCEQVLAGPYATVFGLPLALFGLLAYLSMTIFALAPLAVSEENQKSLRTQLENWTWPLLFAGATAMATFSGYLMYIMVAKYVLVYGIQAICIYCIASALFAASLWVITVMGRTWEDAGQLLFTSVIVGMVTLIISLGIYAPLNRPPSTAGSGQELYPITTVSGSAEIALAQHLQKSGAKMYSAYWCPHCHDQKQLFGKEAFSQINSIECDPKGANARPDLCQAAKIEGFPTWDINGKFYSGTQSLEELATLSGYQGPRNFQSPATP